MEKRLNLWETVSIGIGGMIGGGIFAVLGLAILVSGAGAPLSFLLAGLVALITAYSYSRLAVAFPSAGGTVEYVATAFRNGLLVGTINLILLFSYVVMLSLYAYAFGSYASASIGHPELRWLFSSMVLLLFALLNLMGSKAVGRSEEWIVATKVAILLFFVVVGLFFLNPKNVSLYHEPSLLSLIAGGMLIFLAYEGFELIANASQDVEDPDYIPKALFISVILVTLIYVLVSLVVIGTVPPELVEKARDYVLAVAAKPFLGKLGFLLITLAALLSTASAINATIYGSARVAYALATKGELPKAFLKKYWNQPVEGVLSVTLAALILTNTVDLSGISIMGSAGFLLVFSVVNLAALLLSDVTGGNLFLHLLGVLATSSALFALLLHEWSINPTNVAMFLWMILGAAALEGIYRILSGRKLRLRFWREPH